MNATCLNSERARELRKGKQPVGVVLSAALSASQPDSVEEKREATRAKRRARAKKGRRRH
jgi:hypothetical protein